MGHGMYGVGAKLVLAACLICGGLACGSEPPGDGETSADTQPADGSVDTGRESGGGPDGGTNGGTPDSCEPITACPTDACGTTDGGCGGTLECGMCPCQDGVAKEARCGECGLGVRQCGANETGPGTCLGPDLPGRNAESSESECESGLIYVDHTAASGGTGTKDAPYKTYSEAVSTAQSGQTIVLGGKGPYAEMLEIKPGISVLGGFTGAPSFEFVDGRRVNVEVEANQNEPVIGLRAETVQTDTVVANVKITTADAEKEQNNYATYIVDSSPLTLRNVIAEAGKGGKGVDGQAGSRGADGTDGDNAPNSSENSGFNSDVVVDNGGTNQDCPEADAGGGGVGAVRRQNASGSDTFDYPAEPGETSPGGAEGGTAGKQLSKQGGDGSNGHPGESGRDGTAAPSGGEVNMGAWTPEGAGKDGENGAFGIGGAGGGGAYYEDVCNASTTLKAGPAGAGGGAGGCGGEAGSGGGPGGGSFGLFLVRSDVSLVDSTFRADFGGVGGAGADGGRGGRGGEGGAGSNVIDVRRCSPKTLDWRSGEGGNGGDGGDGGHGAGGAGGVSYGAYCFQSSPTITTETRFTAGGQANGGQSPGNSGRKGVSEDSFNCQ